MLTSSYECYMVYTDSTTRSPVTLQLNKQYSKSFSYILCFTNFCLPLTYVRIPQHIKIKHRMSMNFSILIHKVSSFILKHSHNTKYGTKLGVHLYFGTARFNACLVCLRVGERTTRRTRSRGAAGVTRGVARATPAPCGRLRN